MAPVINGFLCSNDRAAIGVKTFTVPGTGVLPGRSPVKLALRADVAPLLLEYFRWFHAEIEPLDIPPLDDWGYAARAVRGSTSPSFHWAGIAGDGNALKHPLGKRGTFTADQRRRMKAKADSLGLRLGEFYVSRVDGMHAEVIVPLERALTLVRALQSKAGAPAPAPIGGGPGGRPVIRMGSSGPAVVEAQHALNGKGFAVGKADGKFGPATTEGTRAFQRSVGVTADGVIGATTWARLLAPPAAPAKLPAPATGRPTLQLGSTGAAVGIVQRFLGLTADNRYGPVTERAVRAYQRMRGLAVDGKVGPATWGALGV